MTNNIDEKRETLKRVSPMTLEDAKYCLEQTSCRTCASHDYCSDDHNLARCPEAASIITRYIGIEKIWRLISKPVHIGWGYTPTCPSCTSLRILDQHHCQFKYCPDCAQALDWSEYNELLAACRKQTPKPPVYDGPHGWRCPECRRYLPIQKEEKPDNGYTYCPYCRQKLDWNKNDGD